MEDEDRQAVQVRERGKAAVRGLFLAELEDVRRRRTAALRAAEEQLDRLAKLLPNVLDAGITLSEVSRVADVSRPTLYQLRGRYSERLGDLRLAVITVIAADGPVRESDVTAAIGADAAAISNVVEGLLDSGLVEREFNEDPDDPAMELRLTISGIFLVESWDFENDEAAGELA